MIFMIRVIHYDYNRWASKRFRARLADALNRFPDIQYEDAYEEVVKQPDRFAHLETMLSGRNVLIVHPGTENQRSVFEFKKKFPDLKIAITIPMDVKAYELQDGCRIFSYEHLGALVSFVLGRDVSLIRDEDPKGQNL